MYPKIPKSRHTSQKVESMPEQDLDDIYERDDSEDTLLPCESVGTKGPNKKQMISRLKSINWLELVRRCVLFPLAFWGLFNIVSSFTRQDQRVSSQIPAEQHSLTSDTTIKDTHDHPQYNPCSCGDSVKEAIEMGCVYDSLSPGWLQPHCHDHDLVQEFESIGDGPNGTWLYWADNNHTIPLTLYEVSMLADYPEARFYASWDWHFQHCAFYWLKMWKSWQGGVQLELRYDNELHVRHCIDTFQDPGGVESGVVTDADYDVE